MDNSLDWRPLPQPPTTGALTPTQNTLKRFVLLL
jgi:hypothetical protein